MAFNVKDLSEQIVETEVKGRRGVTADANPWLDPTWPYNVQASYDKGKGFQLKLNGQMESYVSKRGETKGKTLTRLTGDAADALRMARAAAAKLGLGLKTDAVDQKDGTFVIKWQATDRKVATRDKKPPVTTTPGVQPVKAAAKVVPSKVVR